MSGDIKGWPAPGDQKLPSGCSGALLGMDKETSCWTMIGAGAGLAGLAGYAALAAFRAIRRLK